LEVIKLEANTLATASEGQARQSNQAAGEDRSGGQSEDRFDPSRFRTDPALVDPQANLIPAERETFLQKDRKSGKFVIVPVAAQEFYPASACTLNLLAYLSRMNVPDLEGGWYKLTTGRAADFQLTNKNSRSRAIMALEASGAIDVRRERGKSPHIRFAPKAAAKFEVDVTAHRQVARKKHLPPLFRGGKEQSQPSHRELQRPATCQPVSGVPCDPK
jgi:hypothetical protein